MIEAYTVGVALKLQDLVSIPLAKIATQFKELDVITSALNRNLKGIGAETGAIKGLANSTSTLTKHLTAANAQSKALERNLAAIKGLGMALPAGSAIPVLRYPGGGPGRTGSHNGGIHYGANGVGMSSATYGLGEFAMPAAGAALSVYGASKLYDSARDYETVFQRFKALNLGDKVNAEADKFARGAGKYGVSATELMGVMSESVGLFGDFEEAKRFAPKIAELARANQTIFQGKTGELDEHGMMGLIKFIDRRGGFKDDATFQHNLDLAERLVTGSGGRIKFSDLDQFSQRGGTSFRGLSDEGVMGMAGLIIEQGGSGAGVAMMSLYQNLIAGRTTKKSLAMMAELGLGDLTEITSGKMGEKQIKSTVLQNLKGADLLQANPREWFNSVLIPTLAEKGITDHAGIVKATNDLISNRTGSNQATIYSSQSLQLERDYNLVKGATGAAQVVGLYRNTGAGAEADFMAAWSDFKTEFGKSVLPQVTTLLKSMTDFFRGMSQFHDANQGVFNAAEAAQKLQPTPKFGSVTAIPLAIGNWMKNMVYGKPETVQVSTQINLDGRKIGESVTQHQSKAMSRPPTGPSFHDSSMSPSPVGAGSSGGW